jgi:hypothetical protein
MLTRSPKMSPPSTTTSPRLIPARKNHSPVFWSVSVSFSHQELYLYDHKKRN